MEEEWRERDARILSGIKDRLEEVDRMSIAVSCEKARRMQGRLFSTVLEIDGMLSEYMTPCHHRTDISVRWADRQWTATCEDCGFVETAPTLSELEDAWNLRTQGGCRMASVRQLGTICAEADADITVQSGRRIVIRIDLGAHGVVKALSAHDALLLAGWLSEDQDGDLVVEGIEARDEGHMGLVLDIDNITVRLTGAQGGTLSRLLREAVGSQEVSE